MSRPSCLRCGDFLEAGALPLCARCLDVTPEERKPIVVLPPPELLWKQMTVPVLAFALGVVLVAWETRSLEAGLGAVMPLALCAYLFLIPPFANRGYAAWKPAFLERLGFAAPGSHGRFALVFLVDVARIELRGREPGEVAVLVETDDALAFLSDRGTRLVVSIREIESVSMRRLWSTWPLRTATAIRLRDGRERFVAFLEEGTFAKNKARTRAFADRIADALARSRA